MLTFEQETRINKLYVEYYDEIKPLTFYVERKYHKFPRGLLKEYRDVFDHISRCYSDEATHELIEENIKKAENHFDRIKLDIYKYVCDYKRKLFITWRRKYGKYDLQTINDGEFWSDILSMEESGEHIFFSGRELEAKSIPEACSYLKDSFVKYDEIMELIKSKREYIVKAKFRYRKVTVVSQILGFAVGVAASIAAAWAWKYILGM